jgi:DNA-directed RNA polymerases I, II, and III subunit RPABC2
MSDEENDLIMEDEINEENNDYKMDENTEKTDFLKVSDLKEDNLKVPDNERKTTKYMTKFERARILGTRALQIRYSFFFIKA